MLELFLEHAVCLKHEDSSRRMIADEMYVLGGEFVVYLPSEKGNPTDLYRGQDFEEALRVLENGIW